jgi:PAS domain S-box-containing protein
MTYRQKILIVDDKKENLIALRQVLREVDAEVIEAADGNEALAATLAHDFAVFLLDVQMPEMNGYELAEFLRGDKKTQVVPIVFLTAGFVDEKAIFKGYEAGAVDYIMKPYPPAVLRGKVKAFLEIANYRRELEMNRNHLETLVAERTAHLAERIKELNCLYAISSLIAESSGSTDRLLRVAVELLPSGFQHPEAILFRIVLDGRAFASPSFTDTGNRFSADIVIAGETAGKIEGCLPEEISEHGGGSFLREEQELIINIARQLGIGIERKRAETALVSAKEEWERTFAAVPELIAMIDMNHRIIRANLPMAERTGITCDKLIGRYCYEVIHGFSSSPASCPSSKILASGKVERTEMPIAHLGGTFDVSTTPLRDAEGQLIGYVYVASDITTQKLAAQEHEKMESLLHQAQKMEAVGKLAGGVAHDFNNMLTVINGYSEVLLLDMPQSDPNYYCIQEINKAGERSANLTRQLLAFARKQTITPEVLNLNDIIASMLKLLQRLIGENIKPVWKPADNLWKVKMDPSQIDQILANLLVNARDAIAGVGEVTITTGNEYVDEAFCRTHQDSSPGKYVLLSVSDNGCGMDGKTLTQIFEPFFTTKKEGEGTGLGLATVFGIVKQNGGFINVYSEPGKGTTFKIYLPLHEPEDADSGENTGKQEIFTGTETILLVEDEVALLVFAKIQLERLGYTVLDADSPVQAVRIAAEYKGDIHLLMTDMVMPEMSGRDLKGKIGAMRAGIKCLFMSGYTTDLVSDKGALDEGIHFLQKPFTTETLSAKLHEALSSR